jgi:hypothetical protein
LFSRSSYSLARIFLAWIIHGLADILVFVLLGWLFTIRGIPARGLTQGLVITLALAVVVAGAALGGWFILV